MITLLTLQRELTEMKQKNAKEVLLFRKKNEEMKKKLRGEHPTPRAAKADRTKELTHSCKFQTPTTETKP